MRGRGSRVQKTCCLTSHCFTRREYLALNRRDAGFERTNGYGEIPHPLMTETMDRLQDLVSQTKIYFYSFQSLRSTSTESNRRSWISYCG